SPFAFVSPITVLVSSSASLLCCFCLSAYVALSDLHPFPTRLSSDLFFARLQPALIFRVCPLAPLWVRPLASYKFPRPASVRKVSDRKSTRLNSSHVKISYAVFCLKKKK